jgi:hypothetical protein
MALDVASNDGQQGLGETSNGPWKVGDKVCSLDFILFDLFPLNSHQHSRKEETQSSKAGERVIIEERSDNTERHDHSLIRI